MSTKKRHTTYAMKFVPWVMLCISITLSLYVPFSYWAVRAEYFGKHDMGWALFFSFSFPLAIFSSVGIALVSLVAAFIYKIRNKQGSKILFYAFSAGFMPIAFILWLDYG
jgi:hypothetical protein